MEISTIKEQLTLSQVLTHYGLSPDPQNRLCCPFHNDKTPSFQIYQETNTCYCFSSNCKTHGKSMDVIDFIMYKENISKHEAILKAKHLLPSPLAPNGGISKPQEITPLNNIRFQPQELRTLFLEKLFSYFQNSISKSKPAQDYIHSRGLHNQLTEIGYNSGQFHHGARRNEELIANAVSCGLLLEQGGLSRTGNPAYGSFAKACICFALRDKDNHIVSLYFRSIFSNGNSKHYYLRERQGLYPHYPNKKTKKLILCESIIDAATLLEQEGIKKEYSVLALYGTNGLTEEHKQAIGELTKLSEIVLFMDGDEAGIQAVVKHGDLFRELYPKLIISQVESPQGEDINSLLMGHDGEVLLHLLNDRKILSPQEQTPLFSFETKTIEKIENTISDEKKKMKAPVSSPLGDVGGLLDTSYPYNIKYKTQDVLYQIKGFRCDQLDSLKVTLQIQVK